jgi:hypothetical protein
MIIKGDIVLHTLSGLYYECENNKQARWMNMNPCYLVASKQDILEGYFNKCFMP